MHVLPGPVDDAVHHLAAIVPFHKFRNGDVVARSMRLVKPFANHSQLGNPRKQWGRERRQEVGRDHEHQAVRKRHQLAVDEDVGFSVGIIRADQLVAEAEFAAKIGCPRLFTEK